MKRGLLLLVCLLVHYILSAQEDPELNFLSTYQTGVFDEGAAEIAAYDPVTASVFFTNADENAIRVIDISDPMNPQLVNTIDLALYGGGVNSVDVANGIVAVAVESEVKTSNGRVVFFDTNGEYLNDVEVGALPDMLTFSNDQTKVLVANEGEPNDTYTIDPEGSVSIIDLSNGVENASEVRVTFTAFNDKMTSLKNKGVRIFGPNATVAEDLEPEFIALTEDDAIAYVALQENNALAVIDVENAIALDILPLGVKDHSKGSPQLEQYILNELVPDWPELGTPDYLGGQPTVSLGGFSGLYFDPTESDDENYVFYTVPDRGPNEAAVNKNNVISPAAPDLPALSNLRPYKLPNYEARIVKFTLNITSGTVELNDQITLRQINENGDEQAITGRGNVIGTDETPVVIQRVFQETDTVFDNVDWVDTTTFIGYRELQYDAFGGDFEGIFRDKDGNFWLCDENRPSFFQFGTDGMLMNRYVPDGTGALLFPVLGFNFAGAFGEELLPEVYSKRRANRGFEAIAYDADAEIIYAFIQSPVESSDNGVRDNSDVIRILGITPEGDPVAEYVYLLEQNRNDGYSLKRTDKIGDAVYTGDGKFLVIERDSSVPEDGDSGKKYIFEIDLKGATNIIDLPIAAKNESTGPDDPTLEMLTADELMVRGIQPVFKRKILNLPSIGYLPSDKAEGIALLPNGSIAVLNDNDFGLAGAGVTDDNNLGIISFLNNNGFDASNEDEGINISQRPTLGMLQPDAIATFMHEGQPYVITANEGDAREYEDADYVEEERIADLSLDADEFPNAADLQQESNLGRLKATIEDGDIDNDGDYDRLFSYGARSFSIFDQFGNLVYDSGDDFERITAQALPEHFNSNNDDNDSFDSRSDDKGPEPEALAVFEAGGKRYALIGLERISGIMLYDISDPRAPEYISFTTNRNFGVPAESSEAGDLGVEDIRYVTAADSPNGQPLIITANEVSGTISIFTLDNIDVTDVDDLNTGELAWRVFPNPVQDVLLTNKVSDYSIYNVMGQLLLQQANTQQINLSALPKGTYILKDERRLESKRFVKGE